MAWLPALTSSSFMWSSGSLNKLQKDSRYLCFIRKPKVCSTYKTILPLSPALVRLQLDIVLSFGYSHFDIIGCINGAWRVNHQDRKCMTGLRKFILFSLKNKRPREKHDIRLLKIGRWLPVLHMDRVRNNSLKIWSAIPPFSLAPHIGSHHLP